MLIVAERINATRAAIRKAIENRDADFISAEAKAQAAAGADFIDVNAGSDPAREIENLKWAVEVVQQSTNLPLCIDSSRAEGFAEVLPVVKGDVVMINSVSGEADKMACLIPLAAESGALLVALAIDESGLPHTADDRVAVAGKILEAAQKAGIAPDRIYVDPCVQPISTSPDQVSAVVETVSAITKEFPGVQTISGGSNISYGLPYRSILNRVFLSYLIEAGLAAAILDPTEADMMATVYAAEALCGKDDYCMNYITAERSGRLRGKRK